MFVFVLFRFYYRGWRGLGETFLSLLQKPIWPLSHLALVRFSIVSWADVTWGDPQKSWLLGKACRDLLLKSPNSVGICTHLFDLFLFHLVVVEQISLIQKNGRLFQPSLLTPFFIPQPYGFWPKNDGIKNEIWRFFARAQIYCWASSSSEYFTSSFFNLVQSV